MPNGANVIEIIVQARDQATEALERINVALQQIQPAADAGSESFRRFDRSSATARTSISQFATVTRLTAGTVVSELDPQLGSIIIRMTTLTRLMRSTTGLITGVLVGVGIAAVLTALTLWIRHTNDMIEAQVKLDRQIKSFDVSGIRSSISSLTLELEKAQKRSETFFGFYIEGAKNVINSILGMSSSIDSMNEQLAKQREAFERIRPVEHAAEIAGLRAEQERLAAAIAGEGAARTRNAAMFDSFIAKQIAFVQRAAELEEKRLDFQEKQAIGAAQAELKSQAEIDRIRRSFDEKRTIAAAALAREIGNIEFSAFERRKELLSIPAEVEQRLSKLRERSFDALEGLDKQRVRNLITDFNFEFERAAIFRRPDVQPLLAEVGIVQERLLDFARRQRDEQVKQAELERRLALEKPRLTGVERLEIERTFEARSVEIKREFELRSVEIFREGLETRRTLLEQSLRDQQQIYDDFFGQLRSSTSDFFFNVVTGQMNSFGEIWRNFWQSLVRQANNVLAQIIFPTPRAGGGGPGGIFNLFGLLGGGGGGATPLASAAALGGFITSFQRGGIVKKPTLALVGEAGPEAIVPLEESESKVGLKGVTVVNLIRESDLQQTIAFEIARNREVFVNDVLESIRGNRQLRRAVQRFK